MLESRWRRVTKTKNITINHHAIVTMSFKLDAFDRLQRQRMVLVPVVKLSHSTDAEQGSGTAQALLICYRPLEMMFSRRSAAIAI